MAEKETRLSIDLSLVARAKDTLSSIIETSLWGDAYRVPELNLEMITGWFSSQQAVLPSAAFGVLYAKVDMSQTTPRFYQGLFDSNWNCIAARQVAPQKVADEVTQLFEDKDLLVFK